MTPALHLRVIGERNLLLNREIPLFYIPFCREAMNLRNRGMSFFPYAL